MEAAAADIDSERLGIRRANHTDLKVVLKILTEAATWQATERDPVWPVPFPSATVEASMARNETYVLCRSGAGDRHSCTLLGGSGLGGAAS